MIICKKRMEIEKKATRMMLIKRFVDFLTKKQGNWADKNSKEITLDILGFLKEENK